jgi:hypothetical protein
MEGVTPKCLLQCPYGLFPHPMSFPSPGARRVESACAVNRRQRLQRLSVGWSCLWLLLLFA